MATSNFAKSIFASVENLNECARLDETSYQYRLVVMVPNKQIKRKDFNKSTSGILLQGYCKNKGNSVSSETLTMVRNNSGLSVFYSGHNEYVERRTKKGEWVGREFGPMVATAIQVMMEDEGVEGDAPIPARYVNNPDFTPSGTEPRLILDPDLKDELVIDTKYYSNPVATFVNGVEMALKPSNTITGKQYEEGQLRRMEIYFNSVEASPKKEYRTQMVNGEEVTTCSLRIDLACSVINLMYEEAETIDAKVLDDAARKSRVISEKEIKQRKAKSSAHFWSTATRKGSDTLKLSRKAKDSKPAQAEKAADENEELGDIIPGV